VSRLLLPWTENRRLIFYDDKDYGMKEAYRLLVARDYQGAEAKSQEAVTKAKADPKVKAKYLARTDYNLGICKFIQGQYGAAQPYLKAAFDLDTGNGIFREAHGECQRAIRLMNEMAKVEARSAAPRAPEAAPAATAAAGNVEERLERLERLRKKGLISQAEYDQQRAALMKQL
jgi:Tfp pilus assembly protein PilF